MQTISLTNIEEVFQFIDDIENKKISLNDIDLSHVFNLNIKIDGVKWDGTVNFIVAEYILKLQKDIVKIVNNYSTEKITLASVRNLHYNLAIKVVIQEGCIELLIDFAKLLLDLPDKVLKKMDSNHILIALIIWMLISAGKDIFYDKDKKYVDALSKQYSEMIEITKEAQKANRHLAQNLDEEDIIMYNEKQFTKKTLTEHFQEAEKENIQLTKTYYIDGSYFILGCNADEQTAYIKDTHIDAHASTNMLIEQDKKFLYDTLENLDINREKNAINLQVTIEMQGETIKTLSITGIGDKRKTAITYPEALEDMRSTANAIVNNKKEQMSILDIINKNMDNNTNNYNAILRELADAKAMLSQTIDTDVLGKMSFEARIAELEEELKEYTKVKK